MSESAFPPAGLIEAIVASVDGLLRARGSGSVVGWMAIVDPGSSFDLTISATHAVTFGGIDPVMSAVRTAIGRHAPGLRLRRGKPLLATGYIEVRLSLTDAGFAVLNGSWDWGGDAIGGTADV